MPAPKISVIMSIYKEPLDWLHESIDSLLCQTFSDFELIIICDNPSYKEGIDLLEAYKKSDNRIVLIYNEQNIGLTKSLNKGLAIAKGEYIARMDADDISMPNRFDLQLKLFEKRPEVGICGGGAIMTGNRKGLLLFPQEDTDICLFLDNCFIHSTVMMRKRIADLHYNENCVAAQDYELWFRAKQQGAVFHNVQEPLVYYRFSETQITKSKKDIQNKVAIAVRRKALDLLLKEKGLDLRIADLPVSFEFVQSIYQQLDIPVRQKKKLVFYLLLSVNCSFFELLSFYTKSGLLFYLPFKYIRSVIYNNRNKVYCMY